MDLFQKCEDFTRPEEYKRRGLYPYFREISSKQDTEVIIGGKKLLMLGSNSYLGLTNHPEVAEASAKAIEKYGTGNGGSRFLNGSLDIHRELEEKLAEFIGTEACLVFSTGYMANLGCISSLVGRKDTIYIDRQNHACIVDGSRMAFGEVIKYKHNDMEDLERILGSNNSERGKLICTDGVFSMEGDIAPLKRITELAKIYKARVCVDDAHGAGVIGPVGRGTASYFGLEKETDITTLTFSKSFSSVGGAVCSSKEVIKYLTHHSRPLIFSASLPAANVAAVIKSLEILQKEPERLENLWRNTKKMAEGLTRLGFDTGESETPIIPIIIGEIEKCFSFWRKLNDMQVFVNPVVPPAVANDRCLVRTSYMATHTEKQLDRALEAFEIAGKELGII